MPRGPSTSQEAYADPQLGNSQKNTDLVLGRNLQVGVATVTRPHPLLNRGLTSYLDDTISPFASDKAVSSGNITMNKMLLFKISASVSYVQRHLYLL